MKIDIKNVDKAELLAELYNNAKQTATMFFKPEDAVHMTPEDAKGLLEEDTYFDYINGKVLKVDLSGDEIDPWGYDRDNGQGEVERIVNKIKNKGESK